MFLKQQKNPLFSIRGSYLVLKVLGEYISIETIAEGENNPFLRVRMQPGDTVEYAPSHMTVKRDGGCFRFALNGLYDLSVSGNIPVELLHIRNQSYESTTVFEYDGKACLNNCKTKNALWFIPLAGRCKTHSTWGEGEISNGDIRIMLLPEQGKDFEAYMQTVLTPSRAETEKPPSFRVCRENAEKDFLDFCKKIGCGADYDLEAAYVIWSNIVGAAGNYEAETIVSSKYGMARVWSWDNCFSALGVAKAFPELAWNMFILPFRHQFENGYVPDCISPFSMFINCAKPPVKGWFYRELMQRHTLFSEPARMRSACEAMTKEIDWWMHGRDCAPCYWHGNDSGADNATCFDEKSEMQLPELYALLSVQCIVAAELAQRLGYDRTAKKYEALAGKLADETAEQFWDGARLFSRRADTGASVYSDALLVLRTAMLGKRLPPQIQRYIAERVEKAFLGNFGVASEALDSRKFDPDGYWRGAVWPADQIMYSIALKEMGFAQLAKTIQNRFLAAVQKNGCWENYDVHTGKGIRCPNYIWGAAANFIFTE